MMDFNIGVEDVGFAVLQELCNRLAMQAKELSNEAIDVVVEKNSFQQFSRSISQLNTLLNSLDIKKLGATNGLQLTKNALEMLNSQLQRAGKIVQDCKSSSSLRVLQSSSILGQMQDISKEIAVTISSFQLSNFGISSNLKGMSHEIIHRLGSAEFRSSTATEMIASGIERSMVHNRKDHESTVKLLEGIAQAVGSTSGSNITSIREDLAILKQEKEDMEVQKKQAEALQLSQLIHLLHITETAVADQLSTTNPVPDITTLRANSVDPFMCPLSKKMMRDPVAILCGHSFERKAIEEHFEAGNRTCPTCKEKLESVHITPNLSLRGSLEEWRRRDMDLRFQNGIRALISDDCTLQNSALEDLQSLLETPSYMSRVVEENLIPKFVSFLKDERLSTVATLRCLNCLARHSEDSKIAIVEAGGLRLIIKQLYNRETEGYALGVLLELSSREAIAEKIGDTKNCIARLVTMLNHSMQNLVDKARELLQKLSFNTHFIVKMAASGYYQPFVARFNQGPQETRAIMAAALIQMQLRESSIIELKNEQFMHNLIQMISLNSPVSTAASLKATQKLMAHPELVKVLLADPATIPLILGIILYSNSDPHLQESVEILAQLVGSSENSDFQVFQGLKELQSEYNVGVFLQFVYRSNPQTKIPFLKLLVNLCCKSEAARDLIRSNDHFITHLLACLSRDQNGDTRVWAMKLIHSISEGHKNGIPIPSSPGKENTVNTLTFILSNSPDFEERSIAAAVISELPKDDPAIEKMLCKSGVLKAIFEVICAMDTEIDRIVIEPYHGKPLLENALAALLRFTDPAKPELQRQVGKLKMYDKLVRVLSNGSPLAKQRAATALAQLSKSTSQSLSYEPVEFEIHGSFLSPPLRKFFRQISGCWSNSSQMDNLCQIHGIACSPPEKFCLVKLDAVEPLLRSLSESDSGVQEAALDALETLLIIPTTQSRAISTITTSKGPAKIVQVLEKGAPSTKLKAMEVLTKMLIPGHAINERLFRRLEVILIQLLQDDALKKDAALVLRQMELIPHQSSYF